jgi:hypothetical protein
MSRHRSNSIVTNSADYTFTRNLFLNFGASRVIKVCYPGNPATFILEYKKYSKVVTVVDFSTYLGIVLQLPVRSSPILTGILFKKTSLIKFIADVRNVR